MMKYAVYYIDSKDRIECMRACSLNGCINWCEDGLKMATWKYNPIDEGEAENLNDVFRKYSTLNLDRRRKSHRRTINMGDVILLGEEPWIVTAFGFVRVPMVLWEKIEL